VTRVIVIMTRSFFPETGGIAVFGSILACGLENRNYKVEVITNSVIDFGSSNKASVSFPILRRGKFFEVANLVQRADLVILSHFSIKYFIYPLIFRKKRIVISHNAIQCDGHKLNLKERFKNIIISQNLNVCVSNTLAKYYSNKPTVIRNGINLALDVSTDNSKFSKDLIFVGRPIPNKGLLTLLKAISVYEKMFHNTLRATVVTDLDKWPSTRKFIEKLGLASELNIVASLENDQVRKLMSQHRYIVVPTISEEPFGLVAIEGLHAGCIPIVSNFGGLREATLGRCITFPNGDFLKLAKVIRECKLNYNKCREEIFDNLEVGNYSAEKMIDQYQELIQQVLKC